MKHLSTIYNQSRSFHLFVTALVISLLITACDGSKSIRVLTVAGGHDFDTTEFVSMLQSFDGMIIDTIMQPGANRKIASGALENYDVIVFYDMWNEAGQQVRDGYQNLTSSGKGLVFLHHSLASYQSWQQFMEIIGGKYVQPSSQADSNLFSTYRHDIEIPVNIVATNHPVTAGVSNFTIHDEGYGNILVNEDVEVLLKADHPDCYPVVGWANRHGNSKIVYLMMGHDRNAYMNEQFRMLLQNAIRYVNSKD